MKTILNKVPLVIIAIITFTGCEKDPAEITIPDKTFLNTLIELGVDTNGDSIISPAEAAKITNLNVLNRSISELTGIEAFVNLDTLYCSSNQLTSLNVSKNTNLRYLNCSGNQLTSLDISKNTNLRTLYCNENKLTSLDISKNTALYGLQCYTNQLTSLDVSHNTKLT